MLKYIFNPFCKLSWKQALIVGTVILIINSFLEYYFSISRYGLFSFHGDNPITFSMSLSVSVIKLFVLSVIFQILSRIFSKEYISLGETFSFQILALYPHLFAYTAMVLKLFNSDAIPTIMISIYIFTELWYMISMFFAFKRSSKLKGGKLFLIFIPGMFIAMILTTKIVVWATSYVRM